MRSRLLVATALPAILATTSVWGHLGEPDRLETVRENLESLGALTLRENCLTVREGRRRNAGGSHSED
jgi:hypothetical protein